jgi:hypothetical protein
LAEEAVTGIDPETGFIPAALTGRAAAPAYAVRIAEREIVNSLKE